VRDAVEYRKHVIDMSSCRLIFGEADFLPGLVVDKFADILVVESLALGIDRYKLLIIDELKALLAAEGMPIRGVYERSDAAVRLKEGLPLEKGFIGEPFDTNVLITENGVQFSVDVAEGQKTGYFLDQKMNRAAIRPLCKGARVLDLFTHTGSFALNAAAAGASSVLAVDSSEPALAQARINAGLNGFSETISFRCADIFELLPELERQGERYDVIILDPPAFAKSRESLKNARKGYKEINLRAMRLLNDGGYLATCSCSHFMTPELFYETVLSASKDAHKRIRQIEYRTQAADHPILWPAMESYYLKFYVLQVSSQK
jgi:23S rRNA (cytosine1962-C5)-methyltransferase